MDLLEKMANFKIVELFFMQEIKSASFASLNQWLDDPEFNSNLVRMKLLFDS
jgi:hypothetical protein